MCIEPTPGQFRDLFDKDANILGEEIAQLVEESINFVAWKLVEEITQLGIKNTHFFA